MFDKKYYSHKIEAFYKLVSNQSVSKLPFSILELDEINNDGELQRFVNIKPPLTGRRKKRNQKSMAFGFENMGDLFVDPIESNQNKEFEKMLQHEMSQESISEEFNSDHNYALRTIKRSTKTECGNFEEEEQIYLYSDIEESEYSERRDSFTLELESFCKNQDTKTIAHEVGNKIEGASFVSDCTEVENWLSKVSSIGSEDVLKEAELAKKIAKNFKDIDRMSKQLKEIRNLFIHSPDE